MMKLSEYANRLGISYRTAWNWYSTGKLSHAYQTSTGTIIVPEENTRSEYIVLYARVSKVENKNDLDNQLQRLESYAIAKGYHINESIKEIGSGVNDTRRKLQQVLREGKATRIIVEHRDRLTRFGFNYLETLLNAQQCVIEVINDANEDKKELMEDLIAIITSFCASYYGLRRAKRKTEQIIAELKDP